MKLPSRIGTLLLGIWLCVHGVAGLINLSFSGFPLVMSILAVAAGALILLDK